MQVNRHLPTHREESNAISKFVILHDMSCLTQLRLSIVTDTYPPEINGVANSLKYYVNGLVTRGHSLQVVRPWQRKGDTAQHQAAMDEALVPGLPLPFYKSVRFGAVSRRRLIREWREFNPDAIYIATEGLLGLAALAAARELGIPIVSGFHTNFDYYCRSYYLGWLEKSVASYLRYFHNRCDLTLVPTLAMGAKLRKRGFQRLQVLSRGVDVQLFNPRKRSRALRAHWGVDENNITVIYVGRIATEKNIDLAVKAYRTMQRKHEVLKMVVVGDGPAKKKLREQNPDLIFTGPRVGDDLAKHYASADLFLFPSMSETYGNVVTEAMASGLSVVSYDYAAAHEHIVERQSGWLAPLGNSTAFIAAAERALDDYEKLKLFGRHARQRAEQIKWTLIHEQLEDYIFCLVRDEGDHELSAGAQ